MTDTALAVTIALKHFTTRFPFPYPCCEAYSSYYAFTTLSSLLLFFPFFFLGFGTALYHQLIPNSRCLIL